MYQRRSPAAPGPYVPAGRHAEAVKRRALLRHMRHQERVLAMGTQYWLTLRGPERRHATGQTTVRSQEAGLRVSPEHGTRRVVLRVLQVNSTRHALGIYYSDKPLILFRRAQS